MTPQPVSFKPTRTNTEQVPLTMTKKDESQTFAPKANPQPQVLLPPKGSRRSSKPIITWFQRKLAGTSKAKRSENLAPKADVARSKPRANTTSSRAGGRVASSPLPTQTTQSTRNNGRLDALAATRRKTISLNGDDGVLTSSAQGSENDATSTDGSSLTRDSIWSPNSALEADEDASVRPIPPSVPPSPSPSRSSSSYLSDPRTFRSIAASTKPTTVLSIDLHGGGMAHIAQAPLVSANRLPAHGRTSSSATNPGILSSGASITFSSLPSPGPSGSRQIPSATGLGLSVSQAIAQPLNHLTSVQAPLHTAHHPRNNPRPSSPPQDNASMLTLASSAYAIPGLRGSVNMPGYNSTAPSALGAGDSISHFGGSITYADGESTSQFVLGDEDRLEERDFDASVRALRPRSSRRGSWESEASRWSARIQLGTASPSLARERSLWTTNSIRTGALSTENADSYDRADDNGLRRGTPEPLSLDVRSLRPLTSASLDVQSSLYASFTNDGESDVSPRTAVSQDEETDVPPSIAPTLSIAEGTMEDRTVEGAHEVALPIVRVASEEQVQVTDSPPPRSEALKSSPNDLPAA